MADAELAAELCATVRRAYEAGESLTIVGSGSKGFLVRGRGGRGAEAGRLLSVAEHRGMLDYRPEELVLTARSGTPLRDVERELARCGQRLPFEPPRFRGGGTLGGAVATGLAGPGRPWSGAVRDAVLGVELVNGLGEHLRFGGQVMKNVAGYDVSRLQTGAFGTLGLLLSVSVKVLPRPAVERTLVFDCDAAEALERCRSWIRQPHPISATCHEAGRLRIRLSGAEASVLQTARALGGTLEDDTGHWDALRDHRLDFFAADGPLWRASVPPAAACPLHGCLITWGGAERWWRPEGDVAADLARVAAEGGSALPFDGTFGMQGSPRDPAHARYAARLRRAFDPRGVFNPELSPALEPVDAD